jgi:hypothetical protein
MRIAQPVVAPAVDPDLAPAAPAGAVGAQRHVVAAVRQHQGRLDRGRARRHLAQQAARVAPLRLLAALQRPASHTASTPRAARARAAGRPPPRWARWPCPSAAPPSSSTLASATMLMPWWWAMKVPTTVKRSAPVWRAGVKSSASKSRSARARPVAPARRSWPKAWRVDLRGQRRGIGRHHQFVGRRAAQREPGHALRRVLVGERVVAPGIGRFGDAPGHVQRPGEPDLLAQRGAAGLVQQAAARLRQDQARHQVFEHRARPRAQPTSAPETRYRRPSEDQWRTGTSPRAIASRLVRRDSDASRS